jgi:ATP-dependent phosphofructokinase / diphosphate-dependent phosphofructokinase
VLGHLQRGGIPTAFDRALCTMLGVKAVDLIAEENFGKMVAFVGTDIVPVDIADAIEQLKVVPPDNNLVRTARSLGIALGD